MVRDDRILHSNWDLYDTRHVVYRPARMTPDQLERGYWWAYREFYRWRSIFDGAATKDSVTGRLRHIAYAGGWKKLEPMWDLVIRTRRVARLRPILEAVLTGFGRYGPDARAAASPREAGAAEESRVRVGSGALRGGLPVLPGAG
jgi:hypothetical protein